VRSASFARFSIAFGPAELLQIGVLFGLQFTASRLIVFSRRAG
jgi:hypothetical protein